MGSNEDQRWRQSLGIGSYVDGKNRNGEWLTAVIVQVFGDNICISFEGYSSNWDIWVSRTGPCLARPFTLANITPKSSRSQGSRGGSQGVGGRAQHSTGDSDLQAALALSMGLQTASPARTVPNYESISTKITSSAIINKPNPTKIIPKNGSMSHKRMPADNSCLFHSVGFTCDGRPPSLTNAMRQRLRAKEIIEANPKKYNRAMLGMDPRFYCHSLLDTSFWGGGPELEIYSRLFKTVVHVFYLQDPTCVRFGHGNNYEKMVFLLYTGTHYDTLVFGEANSKQNLPYFAAGDKQALKAAKDIVELMHLQSARVPNLDRYGRVVWKCKWLVNEVGGYASTRPQASARPRPPMTQSQTRTQLGLSIEEQQIQAAIAASLNGTRTTAGQTRGGQDVKTRARRTATPAGGAYTGRAAGWGWNMSDKEVREMAAMGGTIFSQVMDGGATGTNSNPSRGGATMANGHGRV